MLDTIALTLTPDMFSVLDPDKFNGNARAVYDPERRLSIGPVIQAKQNPTKTELRNGIYKPRLTLTYRPQQGITLRVEFSAPKLVFGNNFDELVDQDIDVVLQHLASAMADMGVGIFQSRVRHANVSAIHYGKNIPLVDYTTPFVFIDQLRYTDLSGILDTNETVYQNGGHSIKFRSNEHEFALYDKRRELQRAKISPKRVDDESDLVQLKLFDQMVEASQASRTPFEVLRIEARLNKRKKIREVLAEIGYDGELTFDRLFDSQLARKVCLQFLGKIQSRLLQTTSDNLNAHYFGQLTTAFPHSTPAQKLQMLGAQALLKEVGVRGLRQLVEVQKPHGWQPLKRMLKKFELPKIRDDPMDRLIREVSEFKPIRLADYPQFII